MQKWNSYKNKIVLVTGASSGIGLELAKELSERGADLILVARSEDKLNELAIEIRKSGSEAHVFMCDLSLHNSGEKLFNAIKDAGLSVDLLINNAGYGRWGKFTDFSREDYAKMIQLNITSLTDLCHLFIPEMVEKENGGIINVGSIASFSPIPYGNVYSSSKSYVLNFTEALRYEYQKKGIQIMTLCPGGTVSNFATVASENSEKVRASANQMAESSSMLSAEAVANQCLDAFLKNKLYVITGRSNKMMHAIGRHLSRKRMLNITGKMFANVVGE
jgi:short-subunit dehydrogenase